MDLSVQDAQLLENGVGGGTGGALQYSTGGGQVSVTDSIFSGNSAQEEAGALDLFAFDVDAEITGSTFSGNSGSFGGAAYVSGVDLVMSETLVESNTAFAGGGGVFVDSDDPFAVTIERSSIVHNQAQAGGGLFLTDGDLRVRDTLVEGSTADGPGGGIFSEDVLLLEGVALIGNEAGEVGGGLLSEDDELVTLRNTTVGRNVSGEEGGGLVLYGGPVMLQNVTVSGNDADDTLGGGGIASEDFSEIIARNTLVAGNDDSQCADVELSVDSLGGNLDGDASCGFDQPSDQTGVADPGLGALTGV